MEGPRRHRRLARWAAVIAGGAVLVASGTALGGHIASNVKSYTGCLTVNGGTLVLVKEGNAPQKPCPSGAVQAHFSGGDITAITAGTGLSGGAENGAATLSIGAAYRLPQGCTSGQIAAWSGSGWSCADDSNTTYTAGTGIDITGTEIAVEPGYRLPASATTGDSVVKTSAGTWAPEQYTRAGEGCTSGQFVTGTSSGGGVSCAAPPAAAGLPHAYIATGDELFLGGTETVLSLQVPAGTYVVRAFVSFTNRDEDSRSFATCSIPGYTSGAIAVGSGISSGMSLSMVSSSSGGTIALTCTEEVADIDIESSTLEAIAVSAVN